jgi:hypothetical protein
MGGQTKTPLEAARAAAEKLMAALAPSCEQIAIAGSIRRGKAEVGDIELVALPKIKAPAQQLDLFGNALPIGPQTSLLDAALDELIAAKRIVNKPPAGIATTTAWGEKYKKSWIWLNDALGWIQVDLFIVRPPAQWGPVFAIRTGPGDWNVALMRYINKRTRWQQDEGHLKHRDTGEVPELPTEETYFERLGIPFVAPGDRSEQELYAVVRKMDEKKAPSKRSLDVEAPLDEQVLWTASLDLLYPAGIDHEKTLRGARLVNGETVAQSITAVLQEKGEQRFLPLMGYVEGRLDVLLKKEFFEQVLNAMIAQGRGIAWIVGGPISLINPAPPEERQPDMLYTGEITFATLPPRQQEYLQAIVSGQPVVKNAATRLGLRRWGLIAVNDDWEMQQLTEKGQQIIAAVSSAAVEQPVIIEQPEILSVRIKRELAKMPGLHRTVLIRRLECTAEEFDSAMGALKHLKIVRENHYGGYWLIEKGEESPLYYRVFTSPDGTTLRVNEIKLGGWNALMEGPNGTWGGTDTQKTYSAAMMNVIREYRAKMQKQSAGLDA